MSYVKWYKSCMSWLEIECHLRHLLVSVSLSCSLPWVWTPVNCSWASRIVSMGLWRRTGLAFASLHWLLLFCLSFLLDRTHQKRQMGFSVVEHSWTQTLTYPRWRYLFLLQNLGWISLRSPTMKLVSNLLFSLPSDLAMSPWCPLRIIKNK